MRRNTSHSTKNSCIDADMEFCLSSPIHYDKDQALQSITPVELIQVKSYWSSVCHGPRGIYQPTQKTSQVVYKKKALWKFSFQYCLSRSLGGFVIIGIWVQRNSAEFIKYYSTCGGELFHTTVSHFENIYELTHKGLILQRHTHAYIWIWWVLPLVLN